MTVSDDVPWGRPTVSGIGVPPFKTAEAAQQFRHALAEYVACLSQATGDGDPIGFAVLSALNAERSTSLSDWVLRLALSTFFPAPWTPWNLPAAINDSGLMPFTHWDISRHRISYHGDPDFVAERAMNGTWTATYIERGIRRDDATLASDDDLVLYLMDQLRGAGYPYGRVHDDDRRVRDLQAAIGPTLAAWRQHASLPYIKNWL